MEATGGLRQNVKWEGRHGEYRSKAYVIVSKMPQSKCPDLPLGTVEARRGNVELWYICNFGQLFDLLYIVCD